MTEYRAKNVAELGALVVREARPGYAGASGLESVRQAVRRDRPGYSMPSLAMRPRSRPRLISSARAVAETFQPCELSASTI